ncbi:MAG: TldD/PmbA family protein [Infirmifilum sp.]
MEVQLVEIGKKVQERALKMGFDEVAVDARSTESVMVKFANSEPSVIQNWSSVEIGIYVTKNQRILGTSAPISSLEEAYKILENLYAMHPQLPPSMLYAPLPEPGKPAPLTGLVDEKLIEAIKDPSSISEAIVEGANRYKIDYFAGMFQATYEKRALLNSKGAELSEESTALKMYIRAFAGEGSGQWSLGSRKLNMKEIERVAETASDFAFRSKNQEDVPPGKYNILLSPMVAGNFINYVADMALAHSVLMGSSIFMNNQPGDKVASEHVTIEDDPRNADLPGSTSFDDEGIPTYRKPIIENGILKNLLHNTKTAAKFGAKTTGNAGLIFPRLWALTVKKGDYKFEELLSEMKNGLIVTNNWYTRLQNYIEGTFSTITRDAIFIVKNGEIVGAARKLRIADAFPRLLKNIVALGDTQYDMYWWEVEIPTRTPYILVRDLGTSKHTA